ncbi:methyl-accepting chemotaxis protein [Motiliproteus sp.]|uniref:methyl-accepting chemotaxis protein n=1 Tax=Motiliproteus sp. TaxID=1898955 RepID=UPI003BAC0B69
MTIRVKMWLGFGLLVSLFSGLGVYQNMQLSALGASAIAAFEYPLVAVDNSRAAWDTFRDSRDLVAEKLARIDFSDAAEAEQRLKAQRQQFLQQLERVHQATDALMVDSDFGALNQLADDWYRLNLQRVGASIQQQLPDQRVLTELDHRLGAALEKLVSDSLASAAHNQAQTIADVEQTRQVGTISLIVVVVLGLTLAVLLARSLTTPITQLLSAMRDLARGEGDLTQRLNQRRNDEIGQLADEVDLFIEKIHQLVSETYRSLNQAGEVLVQVGELSNQTHAGVEQQQQRLQQTASAVDLITGAVESISESSTSAKQQAAQIDREAKHSLQLVQASTQTIDQLADEVSNASDNIQQLVEASDSITELVTVIKDIADQTNLLALNAAIEAARAGEAGRGFAVVAGEVRMLASKTRESTEGIQATIEALQARVSDTREVMEQGRTLAVECVGQSREVSEALVGMSRSVESINHMSLGIAAETGHQHSGMQEINHHMDEVNSIADQASMTANQLQQRRQTLVDALQRVESKLQQFQL